MTYAIAPAHARAASEVATLLEIPLDRVVKRMIGLQLCGPCPSCGGTGIYRWVGRTPDQCFACHGSRMKLPRSWSDWTAAIAAAKQMREDGRLARYLAARAARSEARAAVTALRDRIRATSIDSLYDPDLARHDARHAAIREIARSMDQHYRAVSQAADALIAAKPDQFDALTSLFHEIHAIATAGIDELVATLDQAKRPLAA